MDDGLRAELLRRMDKDQAARVGPDSDAMIEVDGENLPWLKELIAARGWPGRSLAGDDGAHSAWLLVQHMDADPAFQRQCLELLAAAVAAGEATPADLAYLTDRVLLAEGAQQVYGTQVQHQGGAWRARNLSDPATVDERRAAAGLGPLAEYLQGFAGRSPLPAHPKVKCPGCGEWAPFGRPQDAGTEVAVTCPGCGLEMTLRALS